MQTIIVIQAINCSTKFSVNMYKKTQTYFPPFILCCDSKYCLQRIHFVERQPLVSYGIGILIKQVVHNPFHSIDRLNNYTQLYVLSS